MTPVPAVFLDKDGTIVQNVPYNADPDRLRFLPHVAEGLRKLHCSGYLLVIVTNQPGIAYGRFLEAELRLVNRRLEEMFTDAGASLAGFFYCPHHPAGIIRGYAGDCACRKPRPGLLLAAAHRLSIDLDSSWLIGDILDDVEAGNRAGCRSIFVDLGSETEFLDGEFRRPALRAEHFGEATDAILFSGATCDAT